MTDAISPILEAEDDIHEPLPLTQRFAPFAFGEHFLGMLDSGGPGRFLREFQPKRD